MKCIKCGTENKEDAKYCVNCGEELNKENKTLTNNKPNKKTIYLATVFVALIAIVAGTLFFLNQKPTINFNDYLVVETSGYDGYGTISASIDWEKIAQDYNGKIEYDENEIDELTSNYGYIGLYSASALKSIDPSEAIQGIVTLSTDKNSNLSNNDVVTISFNESNIELAKKIVKCNFKYSDTTYTVTNLEDVQQLDIFANFKDEFINYEGPTSLTSASIDQKETDGYVLVNENGLTVTAKGYYYNTNKLYIQAYKDGINIANTSLSLDKTSDLSNGDVLTLGIEDPEFLLNYGYAPKDVSKEIIVSNRPEILANLTTKDILLLETLSADTDKSYYAGIEKVYFGTLKDGYDGAKTITLVYYKKNVFNRYGIMRYENLYIEDGVLNKTKAVREDVLTATEDEFESVINNYSIRYNFVEVK